MTRRFILLNLLLLLIFVYSCEREVSVTPPDTPPPDGSVFIQTIPDSFKIFIEGKDRLRLTPDSIKWLKTGTYQVTLKRNLFLDSSFTVDVTEGQRAELSIDYTTNPIFRGSLFIESSPPGAQIFLNDSNTTLVTPVTINNLMPGLYKITLKKKDHNDYLFYKEVSSKKAIKSKSTLVDTTKWEYFNTDNSGLASNELYSITIDNSGNLWIGSREGLVNYNGGTWSNMLPGDSKLPHKVVNYVQVDNQDRLWAITIGGIAILQNGNVVTRFTSSGSPAVQGTGFGTDTISSALVMSGSPYYFATNIGLGSAVESQLLSFEFSFTRIPNINNKFTSLEKFDPSTLLIGTAESGLVVYKGLDDFQTYNRNNSNIPGNSISVMYKSEEGVWIGHLPGAGTGGGLSLFDGNKFQVYTLGVPPPIINTIFVSSKGIKFIGTNIGLFVFDDFANKILFDEESSGLPINDITGISESSSGVIWVTTKENGLFKFKKIPF